jgi:hypothetical protein
LELRTSTAIPLEDEFFQQLQKEKEQEGNWKATATTITAGGTGLGATQTTPGGETQQDNQEAEIAEQEAPRGTEVVIATCRKGFCKEVMHRYLQMAEKQKTKTQFVTFFERPAFLQGREKFLHPKHGFARCGFNYCAASAVIPYNAGAMSHVQTNATPYPNADAKIAVEACSETCGN